LSSDQITLGSSELKAFTTTGYSPGFYPDMSFFTLRVRKALSLLYTQEATGSSPVSPIHNLISDKVLFFTL